MLSARRLHRPVRQPPSNAIAGATGKTITIGTTHQVASVAAVTGAYQAAAQAIGLRVALKSVSAEDYINFFTSPPARAGVDGLITVSNGDDADPAGLLAEVDLPVGKDLTGAVSSFAAYPRPGPTTWAGPAESITRFGKN
jgi:hypothetical protein